MVKYIKTFSFLCVALCMSVKAHAGIGPNYVTGSITNLSSTRDGLLIRVNGSEVPQNCTTGNAWLWIENVHDTMISVAITTWTLDKDLTIYTEAGTVGYCKITQVDPEG